MHLDFDIHCLAKVFSSLRLDWERRWTDIVKFLKKYLTRFQSGLWLSLSRTFTESYLSHFVLTVCSESLSYWEVNVQVLRIRFSLMIFLYFAMFRFPSTMTSTSASPTAWWSAVTTNQGSLEMHACLVAMFLQHKITVPCCTFCCSSKVKRPVSGT